MTEAHYRQPADAGFTGPNIGNFQIVDGAGYTVLLQRVVLNCADGVVLGTIAKPLTVSRNDEVCPWKLDDAYKFGSQSPWGDSPWT